MIIWGSPNSAASLSGVASLLQSKEVWSFPEAKRVSDGQFWFLCSFLRKSQLLEDLYRANFNLGNIYFRNSQKSNAVRCLEQAKECARKMKDKFGESECFHCIGKVSHHFLHLYRCWVIPVFNFIPSCAYLFTQVQLSLGDFVAARRSLKKALLLGSQQNVDRQSVKKAFKYGKVHFCHLSKVNLCIYSTIPTAFFLADRGCKLEEELGEDQAKRLSSHQAVGLAEQLGDLYCKVGCYSKALDAYQAQVRCCLCMLI